MKFFPIILIALAFVSFCPNEKKITTYKADLTEWIVLMYGTDGKVMDIVADRKDTSQMVVDFDAKSIIITSFGGSIERIYLTKQTKFSKSGDSYDFVFDAIGTSSFDNYKQATQEQIRLTVKANANPNESILKIDTPFITILRRASKTEIE